MIAHSDRVYALTQMDAFVDVGRTCYATMAWYLDIRRVHREMCPYAALNRQFEEVKNESQRTSTDPKSG
jgi:hypothetical protein